MDVQRVGPYTLVKKLGEGGMGYVHLAHDPAGRPVALKTMRPELAAREEFRRRFGKEAEAARRVARFCTAPVLDAGFDNGTAYIVTEYVEGPDLSAVVAQTPLAGSNLEALAVGVATALAAIHQAGVVHRDLKPSNVLLSPVGPRVIDFGIAQLADTGQAVMTVAQSMGTPAYMSPEQARGEQATPASDIFSWGSLVAYAGMGRPPFGTGGVHEVVYRVINHAPMLDGLDERIRPLVERALDKDPRRRPTAQQLMDQLLGRSEVPVAAATQAVSESWSPVVTVPRRVPAPGPARRSPWLPVVVGVLAAVLGAGATLAAVRPWEDRGAEPGTAATTSTIDALGTRFEVRIDSLVSQGATARLQWTVKNVGTENAPLYNKFGNGTLDNTVSRVSIVPPGVGNPLYPARKGDDCQCSNVPTAPFEGGNQLQFWAVYDGLPEDTEHVDVNLGPLGVVRNVAVSSA
ncbi:serine/threonine-protein kinase [Nonomuraea terrae]|uniref:serine/threonine-protein kinase n=1 Tax=Nonomuraea terrae TaxID=2530383 RepID=UPI001FE67BAE|nr:serine/threonine-protein kinase [Nonomuraea terrae]